MKSLAPAAVTAGLFAIVGCSDDTGLLVADQSVEVDPVLDFGAVQLGQAATEELVVRNTGGSLVRYRVAWAGSGDRLGFSFDAEEVAVGPGGFRSRTVTFSPEALGEAEVGVVVITDLRDPDNPTEDLRYPVTLRGVGVGDGLRIEPNPIDFGSILSGQSRTVRFTITNILDRPVPLFADGERGMPRLRTTGPGTFTIAAMVGADGSLLDGGERLSAGASLAFDATYAPSPGDPGVPDRATWTVASCDSQLCETQLVMTGRGTDSALVCEPAEVDFGKVAPGSARTSKVTCTNAASAPVTVQSWALSNATPVAFSAPRIDALPLELASGGVVEIDVTYAPQLDNLGQVENGALDITVFSEGIGALDPVRVALTGEAGGALLNVAPIPVTFGNIAVATERVRKMLISNDGFEAARIVDVVPDQAMTGMFDTRYRGSVIEVGTSTVIDVVYAPTAPGTHSSALVLVSNDGRSPELAVPLVGSAENLPSCQYVFAPTTVQFGSVLVGETPVETVIFRNVGNVDCLVNDVEIVTPAGATPAFTLVTGPETALRIPAGATYDFPVRFTPTDASVDRAVLTMYVSNPGASNPEIPLSGTGTPQLQITCPGPQTVTAGDTLNLAVTAQSTASPIVGYSWRVVAGMAPPGGATSPGLWTPNPPLSRTVVFNPFIVGQYELEASVFNDLGQISRCRVPVDVTGRGLIVTLTWNGAGDVDLHLHNGQTASPWFTLSDCYYFNRTPTWSTASPPRLGPNPELDFDNTISNGPENTSINAPEVGRRYTIGIHNYSRAAGRTATVQVFCGGVTAPTQTFTSRPLNGTGLGNCTANDFWKVATVEFTSPSACTITPLNTYGPSSSACNAF